MSNTELPPLPEPALTHDRHGGMLLIGPCYTADQMRAYARAALAQTAASGEPDPVEQAQALAAAFSRGHEAG